MQRSIDKKDGFKILSNLGYRVFNTAFLKMINKFEMVNSRLIKRKNPVPFLWALPLLVLLLFGCEADQHPTFKPDVSDIEVEVVVRRFEQDLFAMDTTQMGPSLQAIAAKYPAFSKIFFEQILRSSGPDIPEEAHHAFMNGFINHPEVKNLHDTCMVLYQDFSELEASFTQAFKYLKYYFPNLPTPDITTFVSEFTVAVFIYQEQSLALGLDFFLGEQYPYREKNPYNANFSDYLTRSFNQDHLVAKALFPLVEDMVGPPKSDRLLDQMINNGKKLFVIEHLLPETPDSVLLEATAQQVDWLYQNELEIWAYFLQEELVYSNEWNEIRKYVDYSPNSPGMPEEAPGRTANFTGWRIVQAWMNRQHDGAPDLQHLLREKDAQVILDGSKYKPKRS